MGGKAYSVILCDRGDTDLYDNPLFFPGDYFQ